MTWLWRFRKVARSVLVSWVMVGLRTFVASEPPTPGVFWVSAMGLLAGWLWWTCLERPYFLRADDVAHFHGLPAGSLVLAGAEVRGGGGVHARVLHHARVNRKGRARALVELTGKRDQ